MSTIISIVSYPFLPAKLGGQKGIALFYKYFSRHCRLICLTTKKNEPAAAEGYQVINSISNDPLRYINVFLFFTIYRQIKKQKASKLILEHPYYGWLGILVKWASGIQLIVHSHNIESSRWKTLGKWWWPILAWYEKWTLRSADAVFFKTDQDKKEATGLYKLNPEKSITVTYGIEWNTMPAKEEIEKSKGCLQQLHNLSAATTIFLFNGSLDYHPNLQAVQTILDKLNPVLLQSAFDYKIIICGKGLPADMHELKDYADKNIIYAGFVDDIGVYFKGADVFINPVTDGGGIKTKLVEALGYNLQVLSTVSGAIGVPLAVTGNKMSIFEDNDWNGFAAAMQVRPPATDIPEAFFDHFYWVNIAEKAYRFIGD
ncbi:MAG: glycosyltransferase family 4 protein [Chitinophagaceae bacterium]